MRCPRCRGFMMRDDDGYTCLLCARHVSDVKREPLDIPRPERPMRYRDRENGPRIGQMKL